jgi:hypothetical protein
VAERIGRDVAIGSISLETRVDNGRDLTRAAQEGLGRVRAEVAYTQWRSRLRKPAPVLAMIVEDRACRAVAKVFRMRDVAARRLLTDALDAWPAATRTRLIGWTRKIWRRSTGGWRERSIALPPLLLARRGCHPQAGAGLATDGRLHGARMRLPCPALSVAEPGATARLDWAAVHLGAYAKLASVTK